MNTNPQKIDVVLSAVTFQLLLDALLIQFKKTHKLNMISDSQFFGFGNYDEQQPSLKSDLEKQTKTYVNGKYLYNKLLEKNTGVQKIKFNREYKYIYFNYLGCSDIFDFLDQYLSDTEQKQAQLDLLAPKESPSFYYCCYYRGEHNKIVKGEVVFSEEWKKVSFKYVYRDYQNKVSEYVSDGTIIHDRGFLFIQTANHIQNKKSEGARFTLFTGISAVEDRNVLVGTYTGVDKYDRIISGKMIFRKFLSAQEMTQEAYDHAIDPIISYELNKNRVVISKAINKRLFQVSDNSAFVGILRGFDQKYNLTFVSMDESHLLPVEISRNHSQINSLENSVLIGNYHFEFVNNGQSLRITLDFSGDFYLKEVTIYLLAHTLSSESFSGSFLGVSLTNLHLSGEVSFQRI